MMNQKLIKLEQAKADLVKLLSLVEKPILKNTSLKKDDFESVAYDNGLHFLVNNQKLKEMMSKKNIIATANVTASFKQMFPSISKEFYDLVEKRNAVLIKDIESLNTSKNLSPAKENILNVIFSNLDELEININNLLFEELKGIFLQGRQHQTIFSNKKNIKKYLEKDTNADLYFKNYLKNIISLFNNSFNTKSLLLNIENVYSKKLDKKALIGSINNHFEKNIQSMKNFINVSMSMTYFQGNIYQLGKDNVEYLQWSTSHCIQDCTDCRKLETGEKILSIGETKLPFYESNNQVFYKLSDIQQAVGYYGIELFSHKDCRCQFIVAS